MKLPPFLRPFVCKHFLRPMHAHPLSRTNLLIHPKSSFYVLWSVIMACFLVVIGVSVPFRLAFIEEDCTWSGWDYFELVSDTFFVADVALSFFMCRKVRYSYDPRMAAGCEGARFRDVAAWFANCVRARSPASAAFLSR